MSNILAAYKSYKRTWWKHNSEWPDGLEPAIGEKYDIEYWDTLDEARSHCKDMNADLTNFPDPNPLSMKYEFEKM